MKRYFVLFMLIFIGQILVAMPNDGMRGDGMPGELIEELGLDDAQKDKVFKILNDNMIRTQELMLQIKIKQLELKKMMLEEKINRGDVKKKLKEISEIEVEIHYLKIVKDLDVLDLLNDEQKKKYKYLRIKMHKRRGNDVGKGNSKRGDNSKQKRLGKNMPSEPGYIMEEPRRDCFFY